jgi:hypothetical protein
MRTSWGAGATGLIRITAVDTLEQGEFHYTNELETGSAGIYVTDYLRWFGSHRAGCGRTQLHQCRHPRDGRPSLQLVASGRP